MIVYAEREETVDTRLRFREMELAADPVERLVRQGEWESAVLDAVCPDADDLVDAFTVIAPHTIRIRPAEGFAYYALYPDQYREAALRFCRECRPHDCTVIGIRSIGCTLSRVVAETLPCPAERITVRPRGHPFDRRLCLTARLEQSIKSRCGQWFLVVDEGPGLSGSSFACVAGKLNELGVTDDRIVFFPSYDPDVSSFVSEAARLRWPRHRRFIEPFRPESIIPAGALDLSGGQWRDLLACDVPVQPQHERRKYLHDGVLWKFSGLGHYGRARLKRATALAGAGFTPPCIGIADGFLQTRWLDGRPATEPNADLLSKMARYLAHLSRHYGTGRQADLGSLSHMIEVNTGLRCAPAPDLSSETVAIDGRMLPHEWIRTTRGWLKTDALDHHDDHFFPGCQDIAWDIAGAAVEFGFHPNLLAERYLALTPDGCLNERLPFYRTAYLAWRIGYTTLGADTLGSAPDARKLRVRAKQYRAILKDAL